MQSIYSVSEACNAYIMWIYGVYKMFIIMVYIGYIHKVHKVYSRCMYAGGRYRCLVYTHSVILVI